MKNSNTIILTVILSITINMQAICFAYNSRRYFTQVMPESTTYGTSAKADMISSKPVHTGPVYLYSSTNTGTVTGTGSGTATNSGTVTGTGSGTATNSGTVTGTGSGTGTDTGTGTGSGPGTGTNTGTGSGSDTDTASAADTDTTSGSDTDTASGTNTGTGADTSTTSGSGTSTNTNTNTDLIQQTQQVLMQYFVAYQNLLIEIDFGNMDQETAINTLIGYNNNFCSFHSTVISNFGEIPEELQPLFNSVSEFIQDCEEAAGTIPPPDDNDIALPPDQPVA